jgi:hypothetical protein
VAVIGVQVVLRVVVVVVAVRAAVAVALVALLIMAVIAVEVVKEMVRKVMVSTEVFLRLLVASLGFRSGCRIRWRRLGLRRYLEHSHTALNLCSRFACSLCVLYASEAAVAATCLCACLATALSLAATSGCSTITRPIDTEGAILSASPPALAWPLARRRFCHSVEEVHPHCRRAAKGPSS